MEEGITKWCPFFKEWFEYCDSVLKSKEPLSYETLREIIRKNVTWFRRS